MNFEDSWYVVQRKQRYEVVPHAELAAMPPESYVILLNVQTRQEALMEKERLLKHDIAQLKRKIDGT